MIDVVFLANETDTCLIENIAREKMAFSANETLEIVRLHTETDVQTFIEKRMNVEIFFVDVSMSNGIAYAELFREHYPKATIVIVAEVGMSPTMYMKPSILASALLLKPLGEHHIHTVVCELFQKYISTETDEDIFFVQSQAEKYRIPYSDILYFEARSKKIYVCTENYEYGFYDTIDHLEESMSEHFIKCHRSYLVNKAMIKKVKLSQNCLVLDGDIELPLSRSCKSAIKELPL